MNFSWLSWFTFRFQQIISFLPYNNTFIQVVRDQAILFSSVLIQFQSKHLESWRDSRVILYGGKLIASLGRLKGMQDRFGQT